MTRPDGPLCTVDWLAEHADDPDVVLLEVAFMPPAKALYYLNGHIPGARYTFWKDLCWDETDRRFPEPDEMARRLESIGVSDDSTLVLIGDTIQFATYAYWVLTLTGLSHLATVLDGGRQLWEAQGRELTHDDPPPATNGSVTPGTPDTSSLVGRDDVLENLDNPGRVLIDMRSTEEYTGQRVSPTSSPFDHGAERKGRIPGSRHLYYEDLLDETGRFLDPDGVEAKLQSAGAEQGVDTVAYCRLSHRATLGWFAATHLAGRSDVRVYDGSWTEWGSMVGMPVER
jgi:thiosulfate/3-mercaptopyruvate sulfurtransferase